MTIEPSEALGNGEAAQLTARLYALKTEWLSEPSLNTLSPRIVDALMKRWSDNERVLIPAIRITELTYILLPLLILPLTLLFPGMPWYIKLSLTGSLFIPFSLLYFVHWRTFHLSGGAWAYTIYALTQTDDIRVLETLILATRYKWGQHPEVIKAINRLVEQVTEADAGLLSDRAQQQLWTIGITRRMLAGPYNTQVSIRVLQALAAVGNLTTYMRIRHLSYRSEFLVNERYTIAAAQELRPLMEVRLVRQQIPTTLLRASDASNRQPDTLLRAVHVSAPEPTAQLLRASTSEPPQTNAQRQ